MGHRISLIPHRSLSRQNPGASLKTMKPNKLEAALGLQSGELYGAEEEYFTCQTKHTYKGRQFEVFYDELAHPLSQWKAFCLGIGTISGLERDKVIARMRQRIQLFEPTVVRQSADSVTVRQTFLNPKFSKGLGW